MQISVAAFLRYITPLRGFYSVQPYAFPLFEGITSPPSLPLFPPLKGGGGMFLWVRDIVFLSFRAKRRISLFQGRDSSLRSE